MTVAQWQKRKIIREYKDNSIADNVDKHIQKVIDGIINGTKNPFAAKKTDAAITVLGDTGNRSPSKDYAVLSGSARAPGLNNLVP
jgi:hypothetical protein